MDKVTTNSGNAWHANAGTRQRVYLVIMDDTEEASRALHFAARRAARTSATAFVFAKTQLVRIPADSQS